MVEKELSFPIQRTPAMKILGSLWTGTALGHVLVVALLLIGVYFMTEFDYMLISIVFFVAFILPVTISIYRRLVRRGGKLMREWCEIKLYPESETMEVLTGYPNTMRTDWEEIKITDVNRDVAIIGGEVGGYQLRLGKKKDIEATRLGLWINLEDAQEAANLIQEFTGGEVIEDYKTDYGDLNKDEA